MKPLAVAVLLGGTSAEREVSLKTGKTYGKLAEKLGHTVHYIDPKSDGWITELERNKPDVVLNGLHGKFGEDGCVQGVLEMLQIPYTHSGVLASALAMDKHLAKLHLTDAGVPVPQGGLFGRAQVAREHVMTPPYVVKPNAEGSSIGVFIVRGEDSPPSEVGADDWLYGDEVWVEEYSAGREFTVGGLNNEGVGITGSGHSERSC